MSFIRKFAQVNVNTMPGHSKANPLWELLYGLEHAETGEPNFKAVFGKYTGPDEALDFLNNVDAEHQKAFDDLHQEETLVIDKVFAG